MLANDCNCYIVGFHFQMPFSIPLPQVRYLVFCVLLLSPIYSFSKAITNGSQTGIFVRISSFSDDGIAPWVFGCSDLLFIPHSGKHARHEGFLWENAVLISWEMLDSLDVPITSKWKFRFSDSLKAWRIEISRTSMIKCDSHQLPLREYLGLVKDAHIHSCFSELPISNPMLGAMVQIAGICLTRN